MFENFSFSDSPYTAPPDPLILDEQVPIHLSRHLQQLRLILPAISVAILALKFQQAELDEDIAVVLHRQAAGPLDDEIDNIDWLVKSLAARKRAVEGVAKQG